LIAVRLDGGLGNQLFQYAMGRAVSCALNTQLILDVSALGIGRRGQTARGFELDHFRHKARLATPREQRNFRLLRLVPWMGPLVGRWTACRERGLYYNPAVENLPDGSYLCGYWQSYRYFQGIAQLLVADYEAVERLSSASQAVAEKIGRLESVAIHVRRGDYVSLPAAASFHGTLSIAYYAAAIARMRQAVPTPHFFVFSDDHAWCSKHLPLHVGEVEHVSHNGPSHAWEDLVLMGRCRHHIIANSSFSWWGAWLADQRAEINRVVLAPIRWFAGHEHDTRDRYPTHWETMPV
jgi:hypothetical protein